MRPLSTSLNSDGTDTPEDVGVLITHDQQMSPVKGGLDKYNGRHKPRPPAPTIPHHPNFGCTRIFDH